MLVRVFEIPSFEGTELHFHGGQTFPFKEVDWFRAVNPMTGLSLMKEPSNRENLESFIREKRYFRADQAYLVLASEGSFTINYRAD